MNNKDIGLFIKLMSDGVESFDTEQVSREPIELKNIKSQPPIVLNEGRRCDYYTVPIMEVEMELYKFVKNIGLIRESDKVFSKAYKAEEKRQAQIVKKLNKVITK